MCHIILTIKWISESKFQMIHNFFGQGSWPSLPNRYPLTLSFRKSYHGIKISLYLNYNKHITHFFIVCWNYFVLFIIDHEKCQNLVTLYFSGLSPFWHWLKKRSVYMHLKQIHINTYIHQDMIQLYGKCIP